MEAYLVEPADMEPVFAKWRRKLKSATHINNPKVSVDYVREVGQTMYLKDVAPPWAESTSGRVSAKETEDA